MAGKAPRAPSRGGTRGPGASQGTPGPSRGTGGRTHTGPQNRHGNTASPNQEAPQSFNARPVSLLPAGTPREHPVPAILHPQGPPTAPAPRIEPPPVRPQRTPPVSREAPESRRAPSRAWHGPCAPLTGVSSCCRAPPARYLSPAPLPPPPRSLPPFDGNRRPRPRPLRAPPRPANASAAPPWPHPHAPN